MEKARQSLVLEVARTKLGKLSAKDEQALRAISDTPRLSALLVEVAQAPDARQARVALARALAAPAAARGRPAVGQRGGRRAA